MGKNTITWESVGHPWVGEGCTKGKIREGATEAQYGHVNGVGNCKWGRYCNCCHLVGVRELAAVLVEDQGQGLDLLAHGHGHDQLLSHGGGWGAGYAASTHVRVSGQ